MCYNDGEGNDCVIIDVTYVDDECIIVVATVPETYDQRIRLVCRTLRRVFFDFGFDINWKRGSIEKSSFREYDNLGLRLHWSAYRSNKHKGKAELE